MTFNFSINSFTKALLPTAYFFILLNIPLGIYNPAETALQHFPDLCDDTKLSISSAGFSFKLMKGFLHL